MREAADIAYYFHWGRGEILEMNGQERREWLGQINRIHIAQQKERQVQTKQQAEWLLEARNENQGRFTE